MGAKFLLELIERFGPRLTGRQYVRNQVQVYLFMLDIFGVDKADTRT